MYIVDTPEPTDLPARGTQSGPLGALPGVTAHGYKSNVTSLTERIAVGLARSGLEHPVAAAATIAARGLRGVERDVFAGELDVTPEALDDLEGGRVVLDDLPESVWRLLDQHGLEPLILIDLDQQLRNP